MFERYSPKIYIGLKEILKAVNTPQEKKVIDIEYAKFEKEPIDTVIAEKVDKIAVVPADLGWSDIGSWASLLDILIDKKDGIISKGHHVSVDDKNCLVYARDKLVATIGLEDIIIIDTEDVTLVCHKDKSQDVKKMIEKLKKQGKEKYL